MPYRAPDIGGSILKGIQMAVSLEQLSSIKREREKEEKLQRAIELANQPVTTVQSAEQIGLPVQDQALNINMPSTTETKFDPEVYAKNLEGIDPAKATQFRSGLVQLEAQKTALETAKFELKDKKQAEELKDNILVHQSYGRGWDWLKATGDTKGAIGIINQYAPASDKIKTMTKLPNGNMEIIQEDGDRLELNDERMMMLGRSADAQMQVWAGLQKSREKEEKTIKPKTPKKAGPTDIAQAGAYLEAIPEFKDMDKTEKDSLKISIANGILDLQQKAVNEGQEPPGYDEARDTVLGNVMGKMLPPVKTSWWDMKLDKPARYFPTESSVTKAFEEGKITPEERTKLLNSGFGKEVPFIEKAFLPNGAPVVDSKDTQMYKDSKGNYYYADGTPYKK